MKYFFHVEECPHCKTMEPLIDKLNEGGAEIKKLETWHNAANAKKLEEKDTGLCGGVPFMFNDESKEWICGEADEGTLKDWADGKKVKK